MKSLKQTAICMSLAFLVCTAQAQSLDRGFADLVKRVAPGVVNISTFVRPQYYGNFGAPGMGGQDEQFRRFFEDFFGGQLPGGPNGPYGRRSGPKGKGALQPMGLGTGFVIEDTGLILTNNHVIGNADEVKVQFKEDDEDLIPAEIIGRDPELDVALLRVKTNKKYAVLPLADSDAMDVGEFVLAIGNPMGYGHSVTHGILSAKGRKSPEFRLGRYLQTDASINPGNSGGPLINMRGQVIGINNAIDARAQGIGFAIPINLVKAALSQLKTKGSVSRGYLGVSVAEVTPDAIQALKLKADTKGVIVAEVIKGHAADRAGLRPYDVITAINGEKITNPQDLTAKVASANVGSGLKIDYLRDGREKSAQANTTERPTPVTSLPKPKAEATSKESPSLGFHAQDFLDQQDRKSVVVVSVEEGSPSARAGLSAGDLIMDVSGKAVASVAVLDSILKNQKGKGAMLRVKRVDPQGNEFVTVVIISSK